MFGSTSLTSPTQTTIVSTASTVKSRTSSEMMLARKPEIQGIPRSVGFNLTMENKKLIFDGATYGRR